MSIVNELAGSVNLFPVVLSVLLLDSFEPAIFALLLLLENVLIVLSVEDGFITYGKTLDFVAGHFGVEADFVKVHHVFLISCCLYYP